MIEQAAAFRAPGYIEAVLARGTLVENGQVIYLDDLDYLELRSEFPTKDHEEPEVLAAREAACRSCGEWFHPELEKCMHPNCGVCLKFDRARKPWLIVRQCPIGKWGGAAASPKVRGSGAAPALANKVQSPKL